MTSTILTGDALEQLKTIPDESVDLTVTSPPYDNLRTYDGGIEQWSFEKFQGIASQLYRVTKRGGVVVWIVADASVNGSETGTSFRQALWFKECGFNLHDTMIWQKDCFTFPDKARYGNCFEYMFVLSKGSPKTFNPIIDRKNKCSGIKLHGTSRGVDGDTFRKTNHNKGEVQEFGVRFNVWEQPSEKNNQTGHPAPFPEQLINDHIISWSNPGDTVLDPFAGSGTTGVSALQNNRNFIGVELNPKYVTMAQKRIKRDGHYQERIGLEG